MGNSIIITVTAKHQHGQIVRTDRITVYILIELIGQNDIGRNFSHQPYFKVLTALQATFSHNLNHFFTFLYITAERNHNIKVFQTKLFTNFHYSLAFQFESFDVFRIIIT